jgi:hypothetical protein
MALWELVRDGIVQVPQTTYQAQSITERGHLQAVLRDHIEVLGDLLVVDEEFSNWDESARRIDLLCIDRQANLVVVELKRDDTGAHAELQAIRYAAMISSLTFEQTVRFHAAYLNRREIDGDAEARILAYLDWPEPDEELFGQDVRIVLAAADFGKELTSAVLWLRDRQIDIRCVRLVPHRLDGPDGGTRILVNAEQLIPPPEAADMMMRIAEKAQRQREAAVRSTERDNRRFDVQAYGESRARLPKSVAVHFLVKAAIDRGQLRPRDVLSLGEAHAGWYAPMLRGFPGEVSSEDFAARLAAESPSLPARYRTRENELIHTDAWTWAFTTQWRGSDVEVFIAELKSAFPALDIAYGISAD